MRQKRKDDSTPPKNNVWQGLALITQVGITIAASVMVGVLVGRFLDNFFDTSPWLVLIFSALGVGAAIKTLYELF